MFFRHGLSLLYCHFFFLSVSSFYSFFPLQPSFCSHEKNFFFFILAHAASCFSVMYLSVTSDISLGLSQFLTPPYLFLSLGGLPGSEDWPFNFTLTFDLVAVGSCTYTTIAPATHQLSIFSASHHHPSLLFPLSFVSHIPRLNRLFWGFTLYIHWTEMEKGGYRENAMLKLNLALCIYM